MPLFRTSPGISTLAGRHQLPLDAPSNQACSWLMCARLPLDVMPRHLPASWLWASPPPTPPPHTHADPPTDLARILSQVAGRQLHAAAAPADGGNEGAGAVWRLGSSALVVWNTLTCSLRDAAALCPVMPRNFATERVQHGICAGCGGHRSTRAIPLRWRLDVCCACKSGKGAQG